MIVIAKAPANPMASMVLNAMIFAARIMATRYERRDDLPSETKEGKRRRRETNGKIKCQRIHRLGSYIK